MRKRKQKLTERDWQRVFEIRCRSKRGEHVPDDDMRLCETAYAEDGDRYTALGPRVFEATKPVGAR